MASRLSACPLPAMHGTVAPSACGIQSLLRQRELGLWNRGQDFRLHAFVERTVFGRAMSRCGVRLRSPESFSVMSLEVSPDESFLAVACADHCIRIYDAASMSLLHLLKGHLRTPRCLCFHRSGFLASGCSDGEVRVWVLPSFKCKYLYAFEHKIAGLAFLPDGTLLVVSDDSLFAVGLGQLPVMLVSGRVVTVHYAGFSSPYFGVSSQRRMVMPSMAPVNFGMHCSALDDRLPPRSVAGIPAVTPRTPPRTPPRSSGPVLEPPPPRRLSSAAADHAELAPVWSRLRYRSVFLEIYSVSDFEAWAARAFVDAPRLQFSVPAIGVIAAHGVNVGRSVCISPQGRSFFVACIAKSNGSAAPSFELAVISLHSGGLGSTLCSWPMPSDMIHRMTSIHVSPSSSHILLCLGDPHNSHVGNAYLFEVQRNAKSQTGYSICHVHSTQAVEDQLNVGIFHPQGHRVYLGTMTGDLLLC